MSVVSTPAVLLRSFNYSETSRVLRLYTKDLGLVSVMAKGVRRGGARGQGGLDTFSRGELTAYVRPTRDLQTFKEFAVEEAGGSLGRDVLRFAGASVLAEIVLLNAGPDPSPQVFERLINALRRIDAVPRARIIGAVLAEGWMLVTTLGYEPQIDLCVHCGRVLGATEVLRFDFSAGGVNCSDCASDHSGPRVGPGARQQLAALLQGTVPEALGKPRAHLRLLHDFVTYHISSSKPLKTFRIFGSVAGLDE
jgi:DNA repair protein RecO (recombination protein O)